MILSLRRKLVSLNGEKKKGFTLVELLVVIAIIAILATVSTVGYLGFTKQAKISNDLTELTQYKTLITASTLDGKENIVDVESKKYSIKYTVDSTRVLTISEVTTTPTENADTQAENNNDFAKDAIRALVGEDWIEGGNIIVKFDDTNTTSVTSIAYYHHYDAADTTKGSVVWTIATDTVAKVA